jgi:hypothetical protein
VSARVTGGAGLWAKQPITPEKRSTRAVGQITGIAFIVAVQNVLNVAKTLLAVDPI